MKGDERGSSIVIILIFVATVILVMSPLLNSELIAYKHGADRAQINLNQY